MPKEYAQIVGAVLMAMAVACSSPARPTSPTIPPITEPPDLTGVQMKMSGQVLDDNGRPVPGVLVEVDYPSAGGPSIPPSVCHDAAPGLFCWLATRTDSQGGYSVEFNARQHPGLKLGYVYTILAGYEWDVQWVPESPSPVIRNMRIRPTRPLVVGDSTVVTIDSMSAICFDLENNSWNLENRCESVVFESGAGVLTVEARSTAGGTTPTIYWDMGNFAGRIERSAPGTVVVPVRAGTFRFMVGIPDGSPTQQFNVTTSLQ